MVPLQVTSWWLARLQACDTCSAEDDYKFTRRVLQVKIGSDDIFNSYLLSLFLRCANASSTLVSLLRPKCGRRSQKGRGLGTFTRFAVIIAMVQLNSARVCVQCWHSRHMGMRRLFSQTPQGLLSQSARPASLRPRHSRSPKYRRRRKRLSGVEVGLLLAETGTRAGGTWLSSLVSATLSSFDHITNVIITSHQPAGESFLGLPCAVLCRGNVAVG